MGKGVTPVVTLVILVSIFLGMAGAAYIFVIEAQDRVLSDLNQGDLTTINVTCGLNEVEWWINNTGEKRVEVSGADIAMFNGSGFNEQLLQRSVSENAGFERAGESGNLTFETEVNLSVGGEYSIELFMEDFSLQTRCSVGDEWWDVGWSYRRAVIVEEPGPHTVEVNMSAGDLVKEGKLRFDCADIRPVHDGEVVPFDISLCDRDGELDLRFNISGNDPNEVHTYVYYGNLNAGPSKYTDLATGIVPEPIAFVTEENKNMGEVRLPQVLNDSGVTWDIYWPSGNDLSLVNSLTARDVYNYQVGGSYSANDMFVDAFENASSGEYRTVVAEDANVQHSDISGSLSMINQTVKDGVTYIHTEDDRQLPHHIFAFQTVSAHGNGTVRKVEPLLNSSFEPGDLIEFETTPAAYKRYDENYVVDTAEEGTTYDDRCVGCRWRLGSGNVWYIANTATNLGIATTFTDPTAIETTDPVNGTFAPEERINLP